MIILIFIIISVGVIIVLVTSEITRTLEEDHPFEAIIGILLVICILILAIKAGNEWKQMNDKINNLEFIESNGERS